VAARAVTVGKRGGVLGGVHAERLDVRGTILGLSFARRRLHVAQGGLVRGHARYAELEVERGGRIEGSSLAAPGEAEAEVFLRLEEEARAK
jgi:cytoskeletal protein CcmA (bactofilin family)